MLSTPARHLVRGAAALRAPLVAASKVAAPAVRSLHAQQWARAPEHTAQKDSTVARIAALQKQADSGAGAVPVNPAAPVGTIEVTIGGESSPVTQHKILSIEDHDKHADPSIKRGDKDWTLSHPLWRGEYVGQVSYTHLPPKDFVDTLALRTIQAIRFNFDWMSGYSFGQLTERKALTRVVFLETVAGVPGSVASTLRHLASLRRMKRDGGWINSLMAEAENERMHLLTFLQVRQPGKFVRSLVFITQGIFFNFFWIAYLISPRFCHRLVGYLEEESERSDTPTIARCAPSVVTYTKMLQDIDADGNLKAWKTQPAPEIAIKYWNLAADATMRDVISHVRADEAHHRDVNHALGSISQDALNPFRGRA